MTDAPTESAISEERLAERLRKAIARSEDGAGTVPAREAVKLRPKDWHAVCDRGREAAALIDDLRARLANAYEAKYRCNEDANQERARAIRAEALATTVTARVAELEGALKQISYHYDNQDLSHLNFRVKAAECARSALSVEQGGRE